MNLDDAFRLISPETAADLIFLMVVFGMLFEPWLK